MRRYALLIEASKAKGQKEIPGCVRDVERLSRWLRNTAGGAWEASEIKVLNNPSRSDINFAKLPLNLADFGFVAFSGHGWIKESISGHRTQKIVLGSGEDMDFNELKPTGPKSIMSCDACREVERPVRYQMSTKSAAILERFMERRSRADYRAAYERAIDAALPGVFTMYSCSPDQYAGEDPLNGGLFTDVLLSVGERWYESAGQGVLPIDQAFETARAAVSRAASSSSPQDPTGGPSNRSGNSFPFGVCLK